MIRLELSEQFVAVIGEALGAQPYRLVAGVIDEIRKQVEAQQAGGNGHDATADKIDPVIEID